MIAFTICSNNYLAKAKILLNSIKCKDNAKVFLFLADIKSENIDYESLGFDKIILPEQLGIENLQWQLENYNIIEFNTSLKGQAFKFLFKTTLADTLYYFDPDIKLYQALSKFDQYWDASSILLTPHILTPIPFDGKFPGENLFLNHGTFNLGFLGLKRSVLSDRFLNWWCERLSTKSIIDLVEGYFTDQLWFNLVPLLFKNVTILKHPGFNVAYWNLHERIINLSGNEFKVNEIEDLYFYHFSSFDEKIQQLVPAENARYDFINRKDMIPLYKDYQKDITLLNDVLFKKIRYFNGVYPLQKPAKTIIQRVLTRIKHELKQ